MKRKINEISKKTKEEKEKKEYDSEEEDKALENINIEESDSEDEVDNNEDNESDNENEYEIVQIKKDKKQNEDEEEEDEDEDEDENEDKEREEEEEDIEGLSDEESEEELDENYVSSDEETDNTLNNNSNSEETFTTEDGRVFTNPTIPGVLPREVFPEINPVYDSDTSDEETENTIGNVPIEWYDDFPHIGYDINGKKIMRPAKGDELDKFLAKMEDPDDWKTVEDEKTGKKIVLSKEELDMIRKIQGGDFADGYDPYEPYVDWYTSKVMETPLSAAPEPKSRFIPSKWEGKRIMKIVRAIRKGWIVPGKKKEEKPRFYALWDNNEEAEERPNHIPAPKLPLPENDMSYNPPAEYLPTEEEIEEWKKLDPEDRPKNYLPKKYSSLRAVPAYDKFIQERFERCLDLYLCPRVKKNKFQIDPESLIPKLPDPKDLQPFPTSLAITFKGHTGRVRSISVDPTGQWLASGSEDKTLRLWEVVTGRCLRIWKMEEPITNVSWNPNKMFSIIAVVAGDIVKLINPLIASNEVQHNTEEFLKPHTEIEKSKHVEWVNPSSSETKNGIRQIIKFEKNVTYISWHRRGDYFATVSPDAANSAVLVHQITKRQTQNPFKKSKGLVQRVQFHPNKPFLFVATQNYVRIYNLVKQELIKKLQTGVKWISSMDIHPGGDNVIIGSYDKRLCWFDLDLSVKPYKTLRYHKYAIRNVCYHKKYPLFASCSDDGNINIFHGMVYNDMLQNPLIVPVKIIKAHEITENLGVLNCEFHPIQPWIFTCGADTNIKLFS
ncbi:BOP1NT domain-containing protein [Neocallimastix lanati (nom. inval.)]|jgi:ribosome biogenesis protein ERB1|nr:BOP1NT domain-containing protein [Neocallimastix sp. JGI-2020a]